MIALLLLQLMPFIRVGNAPTLSPAPRRWPRRAQSVASVAAGRRANSVATVRSALVPGLSPRAFSSPSHSISRSAARREVVARAAARSRSTAASLRRSASAAPNLRATCESGWRARNARYTSVVAQRQSRPRCARRCQPRAGRYRARPHSRSRTAARYRSRSAAARIASSRLTRAGACTSCRSAVPSPPGSREPDGLEGESCVLDGQAREARAQAPARSASRPGGPRRRVRERRREQDDAEIGVGADRRVRRDDRRGGSARPTAPAGRAIAGAAAAALRMKSTGCMP